MKAPTESDLLRACLQLLKLRGVLHWRANSGALVVGQGAQRRFVRFASIKGLSDLVLVLPPHGRIACVELKRPGRKLTDEQAAFLDAVRDAGGVGLVVTDVRELERLLDEAAG